MTRLSLKDWKAINTALGFCLAGDWDDEVTPIEDLEAAKTKVRERIPDSEFEEEKDG